MSTSERAVGAPGAAPDSSLSAHRPTRAVKCRVSTLNTSSIPRVLQVVDNAATLSAKRPGLGRQIGGDDAAGGHVPVRIPGRQIGMTRRQVPEKANLIRGARASAAEHEGQAWAGSRERKTIRASRGSSRCSRNPENPENPENPGVYHFAMRLGPLAWRNDDFEITRARQPPRLTFIALSVIPVVTQRGGPAPVPARRQRERAGPDHLHEVPCDQPGREFRRRHPRRLGKALHQHGGGPDWRSGDDWRVPGEEFSRETAAEGGADSGQRLGLDQGMGRSDARLAPARSIGDARRLDLVDRDVGQRARTSRSQDRRDEGIPLKTPALGTTRAHGRQERQHLVSLGTPRVSSASSIRRPASITEYSDARSGGSRSAHADLRPEGHPVRFTLQQANMVGRLNPETGDIKLITMPQPRSLPYGMVVSSTNALFLVEFGANRVASIDPVTMAVKEYPLPNADIASSPHCHHERRRDLVLGLFARLSRSPRSEDRAR